jgi:hypothetical protein
MSRNQSYEEPRPVWRFRREVTLGIIAHLAVLLGMAVAAWSNLQKELAVIQHQLERLVNTQVKLEDHCEKLTIVSQGHEYRIAALEGVAQKQGSSEKTNTHE